MNQSEILELAYAEGFSAAAIVETGKLVFDDTFRDYCAENLCGQYGVNYACPPDCGTPAQMRSRILAHRHALVLQTMWEISDYTDKPAIKQAKGGHNAATLRLIKNLRQAGIDGFPVGASGCSLCSPCAITQGQPCRFPEYCWSCMSAYCIFVKKLADACAMEYDCGEGLLAFFGMYVFD